MVAQTGGTFSEKYNVASRRAHQILGFSAPDYNSPDSGVVVFSPQASEATVRAAVDRAIDERDADVIKIYDQRAKKLTYQPGATLMTQEQLDVIADQSRRRGKLCTMHHVTVESFRRGVRAGVSSLAHLPIDAPLTAVDIREFIRAGCFIEPTTTLAYFFCFKHDLDRSHPHLRRLEILRNLRSRKQLEELWIPALRPLFHRTFDRALSGRRRAFGFVDMSNVFRYFSRVLDIGHYNFRRLTREAGVDIITCGNDGGPCASTPAAIGLELEMLEFFLQGSLTAADTLRIATLNSAKGLGVADDFGTIEPGKVADLVVFDGNPLENPRLLGSPAAAVFLEGELVVNPRALRRTHLRAA